MPGREQFVEGRALKFLISFSERAGSPSLELEARPFALPNQTEQGSTRGPPWGVVPGGLPSEAIIYDWIKRQIEAEPRRDFEAEMDRLLLGVVRRAETVMPENEKRHVFRDTTGRLFDAIVVIYSGVYLKETVVKKIKDIGFEAFGDRCLHEAYQRIWESLPDFYQQVSNEVSPMDDELFKEYIVKKEALILARAHPAPR
ncbi:hypothetical protein NEMBOFW57_003008 [Staphylotrichum longicolle]|uniref:Uncharacterized protein n=1 Tax=Staphylotrichum longicolle TaxID=669026 RepID=A0AAD4F3W8_9PEZI|nr:hypothetical protein NEMBOFW57_003008 [Staphylotrichum longicolle]